AGGFAIAWCVGPRMVDLDALLCAFPPRCRPGCGRRPELGLVLGEEMRWFWPGPGAHAPGYGHTAPSRGVKKVSRIITRAGHQAGFRPGSHGSRGRGRR